MEREQGVVTQYGYKHSLMVMCYYYDLDNIWFLTIPQHSHWLLLLIGTLLHNISPTFSSIDAPLFPS